MVNDYKPDDGKPPVMDAVLIPYRRSILAIAAMKADMAVKHKLLGAVDPFLEWMQLPNGKKRLANAGARHSLQPWKVNTQDGGHLHITHAIVGLLMALELHLKDEEETANRIATQDALREKAAAPAVQLSHAAVAEPTDICMCGHRRCMHMVAEPVHVCSGVRVTFRGTDHEKKGPCLCRAFSFASAKVRGHFWTGDNGTWHCTCGAGRPSACTCPRAAGENT